MARSLQVIVRHLEKTLKEKNTALKKIKAVSEKEDRLLWDLKKYLKAQKNTTLSQQQKPQKGSS